MGVPQIIALVWLVWSALIIIALDGKPKVGKYSYVDLVLVLLWWVVLYTGGFFDGP